MVVVDGWGFDVPRTKDAFAALEALQVDGAVLVVLPGDDVTAWKSFRNLPRVRLIEADQLNAYDVLVSDWVIFTRDTLPGAMEASEAVGKKASAPESEDLSTPEAAPAAEPVKKKAEPVKEKAEPVKKKVVKKVVKKKVLKKKVVKKAPAATTSDEASSGREPQMKPSGGSEGGEG